MPYEHNGERWIADPTNPEIVQAVTRRLRAKGVFDATAERFISGIASDGSVNQHGYSLYPEGCLRSTPLPLLWRHDWTTPIGLVDDIKVIRGSLRFKARVANDLPQVEGIWESIKRGESLGVSAGQDWLGVDRLPLRDGKLGSHFDEWHLGEVSICEGRSGANLNARIEFVAEFNRPPGVVVLDPYNAKYQTVCVDHRAIIRLPRPAYVEAR